MARREKKSLPDHIRRLRQLKDRKDRIAELEKKVNKEIALLEQSIIPGIMVDQGYETGQKVPLKGAGTVTLDVEVFPYVYKANEAEFYEWLRKRGDDGLLKETVHPQTLKKWASGVIEDGEDYPEHLMRITTVDVVKFRRS